MISYVFQNKTDLVNHLFAKLETPSPIKIQKTFYLLFAFYGATYGQLKTNPPTELETINYPTYLFKENIYFNEKMFIDAVDFEFCYRLKKKYSKKTIIIINMIEVRWHLEISALLSISADKFLKAIHQDR